MTFAGDRNVSNTVKLSPGVGAWFVRPDIVEPSDTVGAAKAKSGVSREKGSERGMCAYR